jgi:hypothetical protein
MKHTRILPTSWNYASNGYWPPKLVLKISFLPITLRFPASLGPMVIPYALSNRASGQRMEEIATEFQRLWLNKFLWAGPCIDSEWLWCKWVKCQISHRSYFASVLLCRIVLLVTLRGRRPILLPRNCKVLNYLTASRRVCCLYARKCCENTATSAPLPRDSHFQLCRLRFGGFTAVTMKSVSSGIYYVVR